MGEGVEVKKNEWYKLFLLWMDLCNISGCHIRFSLFSSHVWGYCDMALPPSTIYRYVRWARVIVLWKRDPFHLLGSPEAGNKLSPQHAGDTILNSWELQCHTLWTWCERPVPGMSEYQWDVRGFQLILLVPLERQLQYNIYIPELVQKFYFVKHPPTRHPQKGYNFHTYSLGSVKSN